jgi:hypothetical protein
VALITANFVRVFEGSGINRPTEHQTRISSMFANGNLVLSACDSEKLFGVSRGPTEFNYARYFSDLAVDKHYPSVKM